MAFAVLLIAGPRPGRAWRAAPSDGRPTSGVSKPSTSEPEPISAALCRRPGNSASSTGLHRLPIEAASQFETGGEGWEIVVYHNVQESTNQRINESHHSMRSFAIRATPGWIRPASRAAEALSGRTRTPASRSLAPAGSTAAGPLRCHRPRRRRPGGAASCDRCASRIASNAAPAGSGCAP